MGGGERAMSTPHLLLIEDNRDAVVATAWLLTTYGFDVEIARNAEDGVEKAVRLHPDVMSPTCICRTALHAMCASSCSNTHQRAGRR
jgi:CheY-like chemotaxis protein